MIKGGGGALTREKIIASIAKQFICLRLILQTGSGAKHGNFALPVEITFPYPVESSSELAKLGGAGTLQNVREPVQIWVQTPVSLCDG